MSIRLRAGFEDFISGLPATSIVRQWGDASVAKVGEKVFALLGFEEPEGRPALVFKVTEFTFDMLTELDGVGQAPYFAKRGWVRVAAGAELSDGDLEAYVVEAHRLVAAKLTRKLQAELGLSELIAAGPRRS